MKILGFIIGYLLVLCATFAIIAVLWNALMPAIFGIVTISFWQAAGLFLLIFLLFHVSKNITQHKKKD